MGYIIYDKPFKIMLFQCDILFQPNHMIYTRVIVVCVSIMEKFVLTSFLAVKPVYNLHTCPKQIKENKGKT